MSIKEQLEQAAGAISALGRQPTSPYASIEEFVLKFGRAFPGQSLPPRFRRGQFKLCFKNSKLMADRYRGELTYVEGFAHSPLGVEHFAHHAWCIDQKGWVYDRTWGFHPYREYFGIPFQYSYVDRIFRRTGEYGVLDRGEPGCVVFMASQNDFLEA